MKKKKSSKLKSLITLLFIVAIGVLVYKFVLSGQDIFKIDSSASFGMPEKKDKKELDGEGHTEEFWTNNKFKW